MEREEITITKSQIISDLEAGLSRKEMRTKYNMSIAQITSMMNAFGLKGAKRRGIRKNTTVFNFVNDVDTPEESVSERDIAPLTPINVEREIDEEFQIAGSYEHELEDFI